MNEDLVIIFVFIFVGALEIVMGIPLMYEKIKPNWFYGFRLPKTVSNKDIWYKVNKKTGKDLVLSGIIVVILSLTLLFLNLNIDIVVLVIIQVFVLMALLAIIIAHGLLLIKEY